MARLIRHVAGLPTVPYKPQSRVLEETERELGRSKSEKKIGEKGDTLYFWRNKQHLIARRFPDSARLSF
jgi:hypothetical protein